ncbi:MAG: rhodanese-like domain-containing protein [Bradymonadaceae bacterium]
MKEMNYREFAEQRDELGLRLIDVREKDEYAEVHVHDAELFPLSDIRNGKLPERDDRPIALICRSGGRSAMAAQILEQAGFNEVINVAGGTLAAIEEGPDHVVSG